jgi:Ser/Thr protein kinase RdoA (MazF antagonist)
VRSADATRDPGWREAARWWSQLGHDKGELIEVRTLTAGASGSAVYQLLVDPAITEANHEYVLKIASGRANYERARREVNFYRDLASHVPVRVPKLVAEVEDAITCCLLFESSGATTGSATWSRDRWVDLATELGGLHHARIAAVAEGWRWAKPQKPADGPEITAAVQAWTTLGCGQMLSTIWPELDRLVTALAQLPVCLRHGDWHLGNLLLDPLDRIVWIDWQEVGFGRGPEDPALLWQRAEFGGLTPPRDAMLSAYARARGIPKDAILDQAAVAAELILLLLAWPPYLTGAPEPARGRLLLRLEHLLNAWHRF